MSKTRKIITILFIFLFVTVTLYSISVGSKKTEMNTKSYSSPSIKLNLKSIIKEDSLYEDLVNNDYYNTFNVILKAQNNHYDDIITLAESVERLDSYAGLRATISKKSILELVAQNKLIEVWNNSEISYITPQYSTATLNSSRTVYNYTSEMGVFDMWEMGYYGNNTKVAILDTGSTTTHPALATTMEGDSRINLTWNFLDNSPNVEDDNGHGTAIAGIIASNGKAGYMRGVAPNSHLLIGKVLNSQGMGTRSTMIQAIDWALENGADIINLSVGEKVDSLSSPLVECVNYAMEQDVIICVAAGNLRNKNTFGYNDLYTILSPGIANKAITVGAVDNNHILYEHSSAGPVVRNYHTNTMQSIYDSVDDSHTWLKPDLVAPGVLLNTTSSTIGLTTRVTGTSFSTAVVTGLCSLLIQAFPESHSSTIKAGLLNGTEALNINIDTPTGGEIAYQPSHLYQGQGFPNLISSSAFLKAPPELVIYPNAVPFVSSYFFVNTERSFLIHLYVMDDLSSISYEITSSKTDMFKLSNLKYSLPVGQHNQIVNVSTKDSKPGTYKCSIKIETPANVYVFSFQIIIKSCYGRVLIDSFEQGEQYYYSPYGSLFELLETAKFMGIKPIINARDMSFKKIDDRNLNDTEILLVVNPNDNSLRPAFTEDELLKLKDYLTPKGSYKGGAVILFPSYGSNLDLVNNITSPFGVTYSSSIYDYQLVNVQYSSNILSRSPYSVEKIFIDNPLIQTYQNTSVSRISNYISYVDKRQNNGSLLIAGNNIDMFHMTPYFYNPDTSKYDGNMVNYLYADNQLLLRNMFSMSTDKTLNWNYSIVNSIIYPNDDLVIRIDVSNSYKSLSGIEFTFDFIHRDISYLVKQDVMDFGNGTYLFVLSPSEYDLPTTDFTVYIRSIFDTKKMNVSFFARISYGPIIVHVSIISSILVIILMEPKKEQKK